MPDGLSVNVIEADPIVVNVIDGPDTITSTIIEEVIQVSIDGIMGPIGPRGLPGASYRHVQSSPSALWTVAHDLGYRPAVTVEDSGGTVVIGDVVHVDANHLTITFGAAFGGYANLS